jgi:hypothetical protein
VPLVHLSTPVHSVIAYRIIDLIAVEVDARLGPFLVARG